MKFNFFSNLFKNSKKRHRKKRRSSHKKTTTTTATATQSGGRVVMPSEYYGKDSGRYVSSPFKSYPTAYGSSRGVSLGSIGCRTAGPNLASSNMAIGGAKRRRSYLPVIEPITFKTKKNSKTKKTRKHSKRRR